MANEPGSDDLQKVDEKIDEAKRAADEAVGNDAEPSFADSGDRSDSDDQTIAPPG